MTGHRRRKQAAHEKALAVCIEQRRRFESARGGAKALARLEKLAL